MPVAARDLQLAQNDDRRDRRAPARTTGQEERAEPRGQREAPQREAPQREAPQREAHAPPQRDPRYNADRGETRQPYGRQAPDPREVYERRGGGRPEAPMPPQAYGPPRISQQAAIGAIARRSPGGRLLDSMPVMRNGRTYYSVRYLTRGGDRVDFLVDAESGAISQGGG